MYAKKKEYFKDAFATFIKSPRTSQDYLHLFVGVRTVMAGNDGLIWQDMLDIITDILSNERKPITKVEQR